MTNGHAASVETVEYPILTVEGVPYQVKYTTGTLLRLQREGVDLDPAKLKEDAGRVSIQRAFQMVAACISHGQRKFTGEELADLIPADRMGEVFNVLKLTFSKASPQAETQPAISAAPQPS